MRVVLLACFDSVNILCRLCRRGQASCQHEGRYDKSLYYLNNMTILPAVINNAPITTRKLTSSFRNRNDRQMVITTLNLSIGATRDTSPVCNALK